MNNKNKVKQIAKSQQGFTLIEVMLVIVIMAVMASLIVMNVQGVDQRKVMQARELLVLNLKKIRLESADQGRILGLLIQPATDIAPAQYEVVEYRPQANPDSSNQNQLNQSQSIQSQFTQISRCVSVINTAGNWQPISTVRLYLSKVAYRFKVLIIS